MSKAPVIFHSDGEVIDRIFDDLENAGFANEEITSVLLDEEQLQDARRLIDKKLKTPFICFPIETDINCKFVLFMSKSSQFISNRCFFIF